MDSPPILHTRLMFSESCGAGTAAGAGLPPIYAICLQKYGAKATLIGWGLCSLMITSVGLFCIRPRTTTVVQEKAARRDISFVRKPFFLLMLAATILQAFAHYAPRIYLPSFGQDYGLSATQASLLSTVLNLAQAVAQPLQGWLA
jgi:cyanate permease